MKTTNLTVKTLKGANVNVTVIRRQEDVKQIVSLDGDECEITKFVDDYKIIVNINGLATNKDARLQQDGDVYAIMFAQDGTGRTVEARISADDYVMISELCHEAINTEYIAKEISRINEEIIRIEDSALRTGCLMTSAARAAKIKEYRDGMLEGGEGYNPYEDAPTLEMYSSLQSDLRRYMTKK